MSLIKKSLKTLNKLIQVINSLSDDEFIRQDIWAYYMSTKNLSGLKQYRDKLVEFDKQEKELLKILFSRYDIYISSDVFMYFSDFERKVLGLLFLKQNLRSISKILNVSRSKLLYAVYLIAENPAWKIYANQQKKQ